MVYWEGDKLEHSTHFVTRSLINPSEKKLRMPRTRHQGAAAAAAEEAEARATRTDSARHSVLLNSTDLLREVLGCLSAQTPLCLVGCENVCTTWAASARSLYTSQEMASTWVRISMSSLFSVELLSTAG